MNRKKPRLTPFHLFSIRIVIDCLQSNRALADANDQLDALNHELSAQKESNHQLKDEYNRELAAHDGYAQ